MSLSMKSLAGAAFSLLTALLLGTHSIAAGKSPYADAYRAGQDYQQDGKFAEARSEFEKALAVEGITPDQTGQALIEIGAGFIREKKVQDGIAAIQKARKLEGISNQTRIRANLLFGETYLAYPWVLDQARDAFAQSLELAEITSGQRIAARKGLVKALMGLRQFAEARDMMITLVADAGLPPAEKLETQIAIGATCMLEGKYPEARDEFTKALSMEGITDSHRADIQLQIGLCYYEEKDVRHAKPELEKALTMPGADAQQVRAEGWSNYVPSREAKLRLLKMNPAGDKDNTIAALFIGSSMTLRGYMPHVVEAVAASAPPGRPRILTGKHTRGGTKIDVFWNEGDTRDTARGMMGALPWDVVVLETFYNMTSEDLLKYGTLFVDLARSRNIKPILYETHVAKALPYPEDSRKFHEANVALGKALNIPIAPVVLAEMRYLEATPTSDVGTFYDDWIHPSEKGIYLAAYCIYSTITGYSPVGLSHPDSISDEDARALQEAAWKAVQETNPDLKPWIRSDPSSLP